MRASVASPVGLSAESKRLIALALALIIGLPLLSFVETKLPNPGLRGLWFMSAFNLAIMAAGIIVFAVRAHRHVQGLGHPARQEDVCR